MRTRGGWSESPTGRADLLDRALTTDRPDDDTGVAERVRHAVSLYRRRDSTEHDKRSAVIVLSGILEERRELIRAEVGRKDEGALFTLANEFAVRHQRRGQQGDYDPAFLDWMFWWYLGTIELTETILARRRGADGGVHMSVHPGGPGEVERLHQDPPRTCCRAPSV